ncbi:hypothetical protein [Sphingorhabdus contaminans]|uniref:Uncharacterized protein n=1 Tax=Sphingorhabdus contaminans TaxID=1343899 RepID=A0A553WJW9_9SPHN|nr:hypothetical protein [Sphingorhabdus contaminans]TSB04953.1 hypothetical protein FOM92_06060 [Sphingorhabdus contaminans]
MFVISTVAALSVISAANLESLQLAEPGPQTLSNEIRCSDKSNTTEITANGVACVSGIISVESYKIFQRYKGRIKKVIVNSNGGDADSAMQIGRRIHKDQAEVEVREKCISSCANYIVPAASTLSVSDGSLIIIHGAIPRGVIEFSQNRKSNRTRAKNSTVDLHLEFSKVRKGILRREQLYFDEISVDDAYVTRYREQVRSILIMKKTKCLSYKEFFLVLDRPYLEEFGIKVSKWPDASDEELFNVARSRYTHSNIVFGIDSYFVRLLHPIGLGCVDRTSRALNQNAIIF